MQDPLFGIVYRHTLLELLIIPHPHIASLPTVQPGGGILGLTDPKIISGIRLYIFPWGWLTDLLTQKLQGRIGRLRCIRAAMGYYGLSKEVERNRHGVCA